MPRSFLITNRRYDPMSPPPPKKALSSSHSNDSNSNDHKDEESNSLAAEDFTAKVLQLSILLQGLRGQMMARTAGLHPTSPSSQHQMSQLQSSLPSPLPSTSTYSDSGSTSPGGENHVCADCGKQYSTSSNLARHRQTHRSVTDKKARKCPHCDKVYVSMPAYSMHVRTHSQGCQCPYCGKCFSRPWLLQGHIRTHTGEKPFKCPICAKAFADKSNLRAHVQTHSTNKPYVCQRCSKAFALKSYLYKHEESSCMRVHRTPSRPNSPSLHGLDTQDADHEHEHEQEHTLPASPSSPPSSLVGHPRKALLLRYSNASLMHN